jgi:hypothetical protein
MEEQKDQPQLPAKPRTTPARGCDGTVPLGFQLQKSHLRWIELALVSPAADLLMLVHCGPDVNGSICTCLDLDLRGWQAKHSSRPLSSS